MARPRRFLPLLAAALLPAILGAGGRDLRGTGEGRARAAAPTAALRAPFPWMGRFEENLGQFASPVPFVFRGRGFDAGLSAGGAIFSLPGRSRPSLLRMSVEGAAPAGALAAREPLEGRTNYFRGSDPTRWVRGARGFARLESSRVRPGVDLSWRVEGGAPAYGFVLAPGTDPASVVLRFEGAASLRVESDGSLAVGVPGGILRHGAPAAWQERGGARTRIPVAFEVLGPGRAGFRAGRRDDALPLVIDPLISYGSYFGTVPGTKVIRIQSGWAGSLLLGGNTQNPNLVPSNDLLADTIAGYDAFVASLAPGGARLEFATFLGGYADDTCADMAPDGAGGAWLVGITKSNDFPVKNALQEVRGGVQDGFVARVTGMGSDLAFATYLGGKVGNPNVVGAGSSADAVVPLVGGGAMVSGTTVTIDFPLLHPFQAAFVGPTNDAYVAGFSGDGALLHSSYLGGNGYEYFPAGAACPDGSAVFAGLVTAADFSQVGSVPGIRGAGQEAALVKIPAGGESLTWTQVFGGSLSEDARSVAVLGNGNVVVGGRSESSNFPRVNPLGTAVGRFISVFSASGDSLLFSTSPPAGADLDEVGVDPDGALYAAGTTQGLAAILVSPLQPTLAGSRDAFLLKIAPDFSGYQFSSYLGGNGYEGDDVHMAVEDSNRVWIEVPSGSTDLQLKGPIQDQRSGTYLQRITFSAAAPSGLSAIPLVGQRTRLVWYDDSDDETGFEIERRKDTGAFAPAGTSGTDVPTFQDSLLEPLTHYEYRVRALRPGGPTGWSNVAAVQTLDTAPTTPAGFTATGTSRSGVRLDWTPASTNETAFQVLRRIRGGTQFLRSVLPPGTDTYQDTGLQPARSYGYVLRALNELGVNSTAETWGTTMGTLQPATAAGMLKDSAKPGKDQLKISGTFAFTAEAPDAAIDPILDGVSLRLGGEESPAFLLSIPPSSLSWTLKKGTFTWKSAPGSRPRVILAVDPAHGTFRLAATGLDLAAPPSTFVECWIATGNDAGLAVEPWKESKPGSGKFRRP